MMYRIIISLFLLIDVYSVCLEAVSSISTLTLKVKAVTFISVSVLSSSMTSVIFFPLIIFKR